MNKSRGFTLVELIVTMLIASIFMMSVGILMVASFQSAQNSAERVKAENDFMYFRRSLGFRFRGAPSSGIYLDPVSDNLQFYSKPPTGGPLVHNCYNPSTGGWMGAWDGKLLNSIDLGLPTVKEEIILNNMVNLSFQNIDMSGLNRNNCVQVTICTVTPLSSGGVYSSTDTFTIANWARSQ